MMPSPILGSALMVGVTVVAAAVPVTVVLWDPTVPSCHWGHAGGPGIHFETCEQRPGLMACQGSMVRRSYTVLPGGGVELHPMRNFCRGAWVAAGPGVVDDLDGARVEPVPCDRDPGMLFGVVWLGDGFAFGCAGAVCPGSVSLDAAGRSWAPCVVD